MARIALEIADGPTRLLLRAVLEREGHRAVDADAELVITDSAARAAEVAGAIPVLVVTTVHGVPEAIGAMRQGAYGYILLPIQPGEPQLMVQRALAAAGKQTQAAAAPRMLAEVERDHILATLRQCKGNQALTARLLGIGRNTLWRKLKQYGVEEA